MNYKRKGHRGRSKVQGMGNGCRAFGNSPSKQRRFSSKHPKWFHLSASERNGMKEEQ